MDFVGAKKSLHCPMGVTRKVCLRTSMYEWKTLVTTLKENSVALSLLLFLPAIATVAAPPGLRISTPSISPASPGPNDQVTVNVTVTAGSGVKNVTIHYSTDNWNAVNTTVVASYNSTSQRAIAHIPPLYNGGNVTYYIVAY